MNTSNHDNPDKYTSCADNIHYKIDFDTPPELSSKFTRIQLCSLPRDSDKYDEFGRNISAGQRRQGHIPWLVVDYESKRYLY